jgi:acyl-CoA hydrolase
LARAGRLDVITSNYSAFCADFATGRHRADVVSMQLARSGDGSLSGSLSNDYVIEAARRARVVIAEINPDAPFTYGAEWPQDVRIHLRVPAMRPPLELPSTALDEVSRRIAEHATGLIADGSTLQFGVGKIPDAILSRLSHARGLGIHSGLISDTVVDLN